MRGRVIADRAALMRMAPALSLHRRCAPSRRTRTFATPEDAVRALIDAVKAGTLDDLLAIFGPDGQELVARPIRRPRAGIARSSPSPSPRVAAGRSGDRPQDARRRQRGLAVPGSAREERERLAIRHRRGKGRSARPPDRTQRAGGDRDLPDLCRARSSSTRSRDTTESPPGLYATTLPQRSGQAERPVLAGRAGSAAQPARRSGGAGGGGRPAARRRIAAQPSPFHGYYFKILTAQGAAATGRSEGLRRQRRDVGRVRARRVAGAVRRHRRHDLHRQPGRHRLGEGPGTRNRHAASAMTLYNPDQSWRMIE